MKIDILLLIINAIIILLNVVFFIRNIKRENQLSKAMDHFKEPVVDSKEDYISDTIHFTQTYDKGLKLHNALQKDENFYREEVAKILAKELINNRAVDIEFIQGIDNDIIKGSVRYMARIN